MKQLTQLLTARLSQLKSEREPFDSVWRKVALYESERLTSFAPADSQTARRAAMLRRHSRDLDNTCRQAVTVFAAGMLSGVCPPAEQWFSLRVGEASGGDDLQHYPPVARWLGQVEQMLLRDFAQKNFYAQQVASFKNLALYGMQCMLVGEDRRLGTYYRSVPVDEIYITEDATGRVNQVFRQMRLTLAQAVQLFGKRLSPRLRRLAGAKRANPQTPVEVVHAVMERGTALTRELEDAAGASVRDARGAALPWLSFHFEPGEEHCLGAGGYGHMPYIVTRAYADGSSPYSVSPGTLALADVLMVNEIKRLLLQAGQLSVAPPMLMPDRGLVGRLNYASGAINTFRKDGTTSVADFQPLPLVGEFRLGRELLEQAQKDINAAFFVDLFMMIHQRVQAGGTPTAMEVQQLAGEKSFLLAPILTNQQQENFNRLFERVYALKQLVPGAMPPPPPELAGADLEMGYLSPLVRAQQGVKLRGLIQGAQEVAALAQLFPEAATVVDAVALATQIARHHYLPLAQGGQYA